MAGRAWRWWVEVSRHVGDFQARLLLTVFYFTVLAAVAAPSLLADPLRIRSRPRTWMTRPFRGNGLDEWRVGY